MSKPKKPRTKKSGTKSAPDGPFADVVAELRDCQFEDERRDIVRDAARARSIGVNDLVWQMVRAGALDAWTERTLWPDLEADPSEQTTEDVLTLLRAAPASDADIRKVNLVGPLPFWPQAIDHLVVAAYRRDPGPFDAALALLPAVAQRGLATVQARAGAREPDSVPAEVVSDLAAGVAAGRGGGLYVHDGGDLEAIGPRDPRFLDVVHRLARPDVWGRALLSAALESTFRGSPRVYAAAIAAATSAELGRLLVGFRQWDAGALVEILLATRAEPASWFHEQARVQLGAIKDVCAIAAILRCASEGSAVPEDWEDGINFEAVVATTAGAFSGFERHVEALRYLGEERAVRRLMALNQDLVEWRSFAVLDMFPAALLAHVIDRALATPIVEVLDPEHLAAANALRSRGAATLAAATAARAAATSPTTAAFFDLVLDGAKRGAGRAP
jgi:hypothetical protein